MDDAEVQNILGDAMRVLYEHPILDWDTLAAYLRAGYRRFYLRPGYLLAQLARIVRQRRLLISAKTTLQLLLGPREKPATTAVAHVQARQK